MKPPDFDPAKKYPLLVLIHGGPQGVWNDAWSFRWNAQVFAIAGYVVFAPNPRGSIGWGQEFVDDVTGDWGGRAYDDIMSGTDYAEALPYVDKGRTAPPGASYGGYMVNWIAGHTDRFKALVSHDGVFDLARCTASTEELWFTDWEFTGPSGRTPSCTRAGAPAASCRTSRRRRSSSTASWTTACRSSRASACSRRCSAAACPRSSSSSRTRTTGCSSPPTRSAGTRKCSTGWTAGRAQTAPTMSAREFAEALGTRGSRAPSRRRLRPARDRRAARHHARARRRRHAHADVYPSQDDALVDALRLSHAMTSKSAMAGMPNGGGKAVIVGDPARTRPLRC